MRPSVFTTSGSSTPSSWTLVPLSSFSTREVAASGTGALRLERCSVTELPAVGAGRRVGRPTAPSVHDDVTARSRSPSPTGPTRSTPRATYQSRRSSHDSARARSLPVNATGEASRAAAWSRAGSLPGSPSPPVTAVPAAKAPTRPAVTPRTVTERRMRGDSDMTASPRGGYGVPGWDASPSGTVPGAVDRVGEWPACLNVRGPRPRPGALRGDRLHRRPHRRLPGRARARRAALGAGRPQQGEARGGPRPGWPTIDPALADLELVTADATDASRAGRRSPRGPGS